MKKKKPKTRPMNGLINKIFVYVATVYAATDLFVAVYSSAGISMKKKKPKTRPMTEEEMKKIVIT